MHHLAILSQLEVSVWSFALLPLELLAAPAGSRLDHCVLDENSLTIVLATTAPSADGSVRRYVTKRLGAVGKKRERINAAQAPVVPPPSAKQLSFEWVRRPEVRKAAEQARLEAIRAGSEELAAALDLADEFARLIRKRSTGTLSDWLARGETSSNPELRRFAEGIRRDESAVTAAVKESWSNGPVEGHVNRLKTIKRQMYGRAGFTLLRARVVHAA
jgi:transposase